MLKHLRTTIILPDQIYRRVKVVAALDGRIVTSLVEEALTRLLAEREQHSSGKPERPEAGRNGKTWASPQQPPAGPVPETPRHATHLGALPARGIPAGMTLPWDDSSAMLDLMEAGE